MANDTKLADMIRTSMESIRSMIDANTIIGDPIKTDSGTTLIPVSKVMVGYASGGIDFHGKKSTADQPENFGGGGGTGLTVTPVAFLTVDQDGNVDIINIGQKAPSDLAGQAASLVEHAPTIISKIRSLLKKKKAENDEKSETVEFTEPDAE